MSNELVVQNDTFVSEDILFIRDGIYNLGPRF